MLERQNTLLSDLFPAGSGIALVTGKYLQDGYEDVNADDEAIFKGQFLFAEMKPVDLYALNSDLYDAGQTYVPMFTEQSWLSHKFDDILKDAAMDNSRFFFISTENGNIAAPYDGGMDILLPDFVSRDINLTHPMYPLPIYVKSHYPFIELRR